MMELVTEVSFARVGLERVPYFFYQGLDCYVSEHCDNVIDPILFLFGNRTAFVKAYPVRCIRFGSSMTTPLEIRQLTT